MYELDTLRTQVEDTDLGKFDSKTLSLRKRILKLLSDYKGEFCIITNVQCSIFLSLIMPCNNSKCN